MHRVPGVEDLDVGGGWVESAQLVGHRSVECSAERELDRDAGGGSSHLIEAGGLEYVVDVEPAGG